MATASAALPPMDKISMIGIWVETVLYGVNCIMYGLHTLILFRGGKNATLRWGLLVTSTILLVLATVHVGASLQQLLDAFVYAPDDVPNYSTTYWLNYTTTTPRLIKNNVYDTLLLVHNFILIWRLYVVFMYDWRVVVFPIILTAGSVGSAYAATAPSAPPDNGMYGSVTTSLIISAWVMGLILNVSLSGAIVVRLWRISRRIASLTATSTNRFASSIRLVVESGAFTAVAGVFVVALFTSNSPAALTGLDVICQLVVLTHLLILVQVQVGQTDRYRISRNLAVTTAQNGMTFRAGILQESQQDLPIHTSLPRLPRSSEHGSHV